MKFKFLIIILLPFVTACLFMSLPVFQHIKSEIKKEIKIKIARHKFNDSELQQFSEIDLLKANWLDSKEFILNEKMYDVVKVEVINTKKIYFVIKDHKETNIRTYENKISSLFQFTKDPNLVFKIPAVNKFPSHNYYNISTSSFNFIKLASSKIELKFNFKNKKIVSPIFNIYYPPKIYC